MIKRFSALLALTAAVLATSAGAAGTTANTPISNTGVFDYIDDAGTMQTVSSTPVTITVTQVAGITISLDGTVANPGQTVFAAPGTTGVLPYTVTNTGNGNDSVVLTTTNGAGANQPGVTYFYDAALTQPVVNNTVALTPDQSRTIYAAYTVPAGQQGGAGTYVDPVGTSTVDPTVVDNNNVGLISATRVHSVSVTVNNALQVTTPGSVVGTHSLKNTGNTPIASGDVTLLATVTDPNAIFATISYQFGDGTQSGAASTDVNTALSNYLNLGAGNPLAAGQTITLTTTYTAQAGKTAGQQATDAVKGYFTQANTPADVYNTSAANATTGTDTVTVIAGKANVVKTADNCGTDVTCAAPILNTTTGKPGDYIRYTIQVSNIGTGNLKMPILHDTLNSALTYVSSTASSNQGGGQAVYSTDNATYTTAAPLTLATGGTLYAGFDSNTSGGKPDAVDTLTMNNTFTLVILTKIK